MSHSLIMPKQAGQIDVFYASIKIYYEAHLRGEEWLSNTEYKSLIIRECPRIARDTVQNEPYLVKQSELARYFGLVQYDYTTRIGRAKITKKGILFYGAYKEGNLNKQRAIIMDSVIHDSFGRNNTAIKSSDSDVDAPKLFLKAALDLRGITRSDLSYLLYMTHDMQIQYADAIADYKASGEEREIILPPNLSNKYGDVKFTVLLETLDLVVKIKNKYYLSTYSKSNYLSEITKLSIYNRKPDIVYSLGREEITHVGDFEDTDQTTIILSFVYDIHSTRFIRENNRLPEPIYDANNNIVGYRTNPRIAKTALDIADYKCKINESDHVTFMSKNDRQFMEAHHLIPMHAQKDFSNNLDRVENIVSLCPNCHSAIHLGSESVRLDYLRKLYNDNIDTLKSVGLYISFGDLFSKYYK